MDIILQRLLIGFGISLMFGMIAFMKEMVDDTGFFAGVVIFTLVYVFLDWQAYAIIVAFFVITGSAITIENKDKATKGEFELYKAKRPIDRVLGRSLAGVIFAALFFLTYRPEFILGFVASYAEAIFDTISTKLGKQLSKEAVLITNFKVVRHGTPGGISFAGTSLGFLAAAILGAVAFITHLIRFNQMFIILIGAFTGSIIDSYLNAYSYQKKPTPNEFINFLSSMAAGLLAIWIQTILTLLGITV